MKILNNKSFDTEFESRLYNRVAVRLLPYLILVLAVAFIDRLNVGFAKLQMAADIGLSDVAYGMGAGIFFVGYCLFEIPSNLISQRVGIRRWLSLIMCLWGGVSITMMFITNEHQFYVLRFLLGVFEAGCYPGAMLFMTYWFPPRLRSQVSALFFLGLTCAGFVGGPLSGAIMSHMGGVSGLRGWQWLFMLEGLPAVVLGIVTFFYLTDNPLKAKWLQEKERRYIHSEIEKSKSISSATAKVKVSAAFRSRTIWTLSIANLGILGTASCVGFWMPQIIKNNGVSRLFDVGLLSAVPYIFSGICMILVARHSDATGERRWHAILALFASMIGNLLVLALGNTLSGALFALTLVVIGTQSVAGVLWTVPGTILSGTAAGVAISMVTMGGNIGGYFLPLLIGYIKTSSGHIEYGFLGIAALQFVGLIGLYRIPAAHFNGPVEKATKADFRSSVDANIG